MKSAVLALAAAFTFSVSCAFGQDLTCERQMLRAAHKHGIPLGMLYAIGLTETGRGDSLRPYALNIEGRAVYDRDRRAALDRFKAAQQAGARSIDVGCMQINLKHHPDAFASLDDAFDPSTNVAYGADFLKSLHDQTNGWLAAARRYHSATPEKGEPYGELVLANWTGAAKQKELAADTAVTSTTQPQPDPVQLASTAGFLRAEPVRATPITGNQSLFAQFYTPPPSMSAPQPASGKPTGQMMGKTSGSLFASTQRLLPRRVVPGQTGLTLQDYRNN